MKKLSINKILNKNLNKPSIELIIMGSKLSDNLNIKNPYLTKTNDVLIDLIKEIKETISSFGISCLSLNQINIPVYGFVQLKPKYLIPNKWFKYNQKPEDYEVIFNPFILNHDNINLYKEEYCFSHPNLSVVLPRYLTIGVEYINENFEKIYEKRVGFNSRIFQHNFDKCEGKPILNEALENQHPFWFKEYDEKLTEKESKFYNYLNEMEKKNKDLDNNKLKEILESNN